MKTKTKQPKWEEELKGLYLVKRKALPARYNNYKGEIFYELLGYEPSGKDIVFVVPFSTLLQSQRTQILGEIGLEKLGEFDLIKAIKFKQRVAGNKDAEFGYEQSLSLIKIWFKKALQKIKEV